MQMTRRPAAVRAAAQPIRTSASGQPAAFPLSASTSTGPGSTNGLFVLHFLTAAHRQECLRGSAGTAAAAAGRQKGSAGTHPGFLRLCQMGRWSSKGWAATVGGAIKAYCGTKAGETCGAATLLALGRFPAGVAILFLVDHHEIATIEGATLNFSLYQ